MTSVEERYCRAIQSSNLKVAPLDVSPSAGDVGALIAAGWIREGLATLLYRLRVEYDSCDMRDITPLQAACAPDRILKLALAVEDETAEQGASRRNEYESKMREWDAAEAARIAKDVADRRLIAKALALVSMRSLPAARRALGEYAMDLATRIGYDGTDVMAITGNVLDMWLDPNCPHCEGRGFNGGFGKPQVWCVGHGKCNRTGRRQLRVKREASLALANCLLADIGRKTSNVDHMMRRFLRQSETV